MEQEKIKYIEVMKMGFIEEKGYDSVYFDEYGYNYSIITKDLTEKIYLDWAKETQLCKMVRIGNPGHCNVKAEMPIRDLEHLKEIIDFFVD